MIIIIRMTMKKWGRDEMEIWQSGNYLTTCVELM